MRLPFHSSFRNICVSSLLVIQPSLSFMSRTYRPFSVSSSATRRRQMSEIPSDPSQGNALGGTQPAATQLSREDMRQRRLAALLGRGGSTTTTAVTSGTHTGTNMDTTLPSAAQKPQIFGTKRAASLNDEVIDLCDSSEDEGDNKKPRAPCVAKKSDTIIRNPYRQATTDIVSIESDDDDDSNQPTRKRPRKAPASSRGSAASQKKKTTRPTLSSSIIDGGGTTPFQIATYNIWFQVDVHGQERMNAIARLLQQQGRAVSGNNDSNKNHPLWFMAFQEVIDPLDGYLFSKLGDNYQIVRQPRVLVPYGCALAISRQLTILDSGYQRFTNTGMDRGILYVRAQLPCHDSSSQQVLFTTTHLESYTGPDYNGSAQRKVQILELEDFCRSQLAQHANCNLAVITGDLNWDDERVRSKGPDPTLLEHLKDRGWRDAWLECNQRLSKAEQKQNVGFTYDAKVSPMLGGNLRRRFDRVLLLGNGSSQSTGVQIRKTELIGKTALPNKTWKKTNPFNNTVRTVAVTPSDHFGLAVHVEM